MGYLMKINASRLGPSLYCNITSWFAVAPVEIKTRRIIRENCKRFESRSHFKIRLNLIVRVNVVLPVGPLLLTVTDVSTTRAAVIFRVKVSCITSVDGIILWL